MNYEVREGKEDVFETAFNKVHNAMRGIDGHRDSHMYRDINQPGHYLILSRWNDRASFDAFIGSEAFRKVTNWGKEEILVGRPHHEVFGEGE